MEFIAIIVDGMMMNWENHINVSVIGIWDAVGTARIWTLVVTLAPRSSPGPVQAVGDAVASTTTTFAGRLDVFPVHVSSCLLRSSASKSGCFSRTSVNTSGTRMATLSLSTSTRIIRCSLAPSGPGFEVLLACKARLHGL